MCLICLDVQKNSLTVKEIARNLKEMQIDDIEHVFDIIRLLESKGIYEEVEAEIQAVDYETKSGAW